MKKITVFLCSLFVTFSVFSQVKVQKMEEGLLFTENDKQILFYQIEPTSKQGKYERCNYIHPLWGIDGTVLTEDFPVDHLHHRGVFWAWHQILVDGESVGDGWALKHFKQKVFDTKVESLKDGSMVLETQVYWKSDIWKPNGKEIPFLKENTRITIHKQKENYRKIDFKISLLALADNLQIGGSDDEKGYGGFSARIVLPEDVNFSGDTGEITPRNTAVKSDDFVQIYGSFGKNGSKGGIVMIDDVQNPMYPQSWILRKEKSMQNVVFPGRHTVAVSTKENLVLRYSLLVYTGKLSNEKIKKIISR